MRLELALSIPSRHGEAARSNRDLGCRRGQPMSAFHPLRTLALCVCSQPMFKIRRNLPRALVSVALIVAGPIGTGLVAHEHLVPVWVAGATGMLVTTAGIALLGSLIRQASRE